MATKKISVKTEEFRSWLQEKGGITLSKKELKLFFTGVDSLFQRLGIPKLELADETDPYKVRIIVAEVVLRQSAALGDSFLAYRGVVDFLISYAEFLSSQPKEIRSNQDSGRNTKRSTAPIPNSERRPSTPKGERTSVDDILTVCYFLSRINDRAYKALGYHSFREAFTELGMIFNEKPSYIKNVCDEFDPYFDNGRAGWYQKPLSPTRKAVLDRFAAVTDEELIRVVHSIIANHTGKTEQSLEITETRKRITINLIM